MPKRADIHKILVIGAGPIIIGQACEFDYSGTQACKALRKKAYGVVLVNSNPATIMTDPEMADRTHIEPITPETVAMIIERERPDALLPTLGGQTGLNTAVELTREITPAHISVKKAVFPFSRLPDVDTLLGPEMKSTGEVMGIDRDFGAAYAKAQLGAGQRLPVYGTVFMSFNDRDKKAVLSVACNFKNMGFNIMATRGTAAFLEAQGIPSVRINKVSAGRPHVVDAIKNGEIQMIINTGAGDKPRQDGYMIRRAAIKYNLPYATTVAGARAMCRGIAAPSANLFGHISPTTAAHVRAQLCGKLDLILAEPVPQTDLGLAIMDRLKRAANHPAAAQKGG